MRATLLCVVFSMSAWAQSVVTTEQFSASFPAAPGYSEQTVPSPVGDLHMKTWALDEGSSYMALSVVSYPEAMVKNADVNKILEGARDGSIGNVKGALEKDTKIFLESGAPKKKFPGLEFTATAPGDQRIASRMWLIDNELVQLMVVRDGKKGTDAPFHTFATSFKLKPPAKSAPKK